MQQLYPPSTQRLPKHTQNMLHNLVHDTTEVEPGSVQYAAANGLAVELERIRRMLVQDHTLPQRADVRQTGHVSGATATRIDEGSIENFLQGIPSRLAFSEYESYAPPAGSSFPDFDSGAAVDGGVVVHIPLPDGTGVLARVEDQEVESLDTVDGHVVMSSSPLDYMIAPVPGIRTQEIAVQMRGLDVTFAGVGEMSITVTFTGVGNYVYSSSLPAFRNRREFAYATQPLNMYDAEGNLVEYEEVSGGALNLFDTSPNDETYTLYYEGEYTNIQPVFDSAGPIAQFTETTISLTPIASYLNDIPPRENVTCIQRKDVIADAYLQDGTPVPISREGFVGNVYAGHRIDHALPGAYYIFVLGENQITLIEPESRLHYHYSAPPDAFALTWLPNGKLGVLTSTPTDITAHEIEEIRTPSSSSPTRPSPSPTP